MANDAISQALGIDQDADPVVEVLPVQKAEDFEFARENIRNILEKGSSALDKMIEVADLSQHPRSYEVVAELIKALSETNKDLLELAQRQKKIEAADAKKALPGTVNNNLFIGSTADLQKLIKQARDESSAHDES